MPHYRLFYGYRQIVEMDELPAIGDRFQVYAANLGLLNDIEVTRLNGNGFDILAKKTKRKKVKVDDPTIPTIRLVWLAPRPDLPEQSTNELE